MSDRNNEPPNIQNLFAQVMRDIQNGFSQIEQKLNQTVQPDAPRTEEGQPQTQTAPMQQQQTQPRPPRPTVPYEGQKWEYKVVYVNFRGQVSSEGEQVIIGRGERRSAFVRQYLDELGLQGWELAGVSPLAETENSYLIFKRPYTGTNTPPETATRAGQRVQIEEVDESNPVAEV
jgi:hypothetical protein